MSDRPTDHPAVTVSQDADTEHEHVPLHARGQDFVQWNVECPIDQSVMNEYNMLIYIESLE